MLLNLSIRHFVIYLPLEPLEKSAIAWPKISILRSENADFYADWWFYTQWRVAKKAVTWKLMEMFMWSSFWINLPVFSKWSISVSFLQMNCLRFYKSYWRVSLYSIHPYMFSSNWYLSCHNLGIYRPLIIVPGCQG